MKIALYGRTFGESFHSSFLKLISELSRTRTELYIFGPFYDFLVKELKLDLKVSALFHHENDLPVGIDYMFSIGGDGTFLESVSLVRNTNVPLVGFNSGRMGFLAEISSGQIAEAIAAIQQGKFSLEPRTLLKLETQENLFGTNNFALNEFTVQKRETSSMITIHTWINNEYLNSYWADGLIIATPTGSTAYSLSTGGPIVVPGASTFIITPIAPHNMNVRPIVVPDDVVLSLKVEGRSSNFMVSLDYRSSSFDPGMELRVSRADFTIKILKLENHSFYSTLRNKLMWGLDKRN
ncbi:MAG: NAD kinase [Bacteroidia bacterium]|nr:NAD kinase [Bacteroidia bacterium]